MPASEERRREVERDDQVGAVAALVVAGGRRRGCRSRGRRPSNQTACRITARGEDRRVDRRGARSRFCPSSDDVVAASALALCGPGVSRGWRSVCATTCQRPSRRDQTSVTPEDVREVDGVGGDLREAGMDDSGVAEDVDVHRLEREARDQVAAEGGAHPLLARHRLGVQVDGGEAEARRRRAPRAGRRRAAGAPPSTPARGGGSPARSASVSAMAGRLSEPCAPVCAARRSACGRGGRLRSAQLAAAVACSGRRRCRSRRTSAARARPRRRGRPWRRRRSAGPRCR